MIILRINVDFDQACKADNLKVNYSFRMKQSKLLVFRFSCLINVRKMSTGKFPSELVDRQIQDRSDF